MSSVLIKFDKECSENAFDIIRKILDENDCTESSVYRRGFDKDGRELFSYSIYSDDSEKKEFACNAFKNYDWKSEGITGFEMPEMISCEEYEVEIKPLGIIEFLE
jgi:hypothetical protein